MARKSSGKQSGGTRRGSGQPRGPRISRRTIKRDPDSSQLLERGAGPGADEQLDLSVDSPSEITTERGPGTDAAHPMGGPGREPDEPAHDRRGGSRGEGGYSTLGGGVYPDEGAPEQQYGTQPRGNPERRAQKRRTDEEIGRELHEILLTDPELDAREVEVAVERGIVTLSGLVDSRDAKLLAQELVESVVGVRDVHNRLKVAR